MNPSDHDERSALMPGTDQRAAAPEVDAYDGDKAPDEIEQDIERTRAGLTATLGALERKLAPGQLLEQGMDMLRTIGADPGELTHQITQTVRKYPVPLALIGAGLGWMLWSSTAPRDSFGRLPGHGLTDRLSDKISGAASSVADSVATTAQSAVSSVKDAVGSLPAYVTSGDTAYARTKSPEGPIASGQGSESLQDKVTGTIDRAKQAGGEMMDQASGYVSSATDYVSGAGDRVREIAGETGERARHVGDRIRQMMDEHPLAVGGLALLAGAVVAMLLPPTRQENQVMGGARDGLRDQALETGRDAYQRVGAVAEKAASAAAEAAREEAEKQHILVDKVAG